jgi:FMN reductase
VQLSVVVGNPKAKSRTLLVADAVARRIVAGTLGAAQVFDLCNYAKHLFEWPHAEVAALSEAVARSDVVVFASPTYKAAYTGLLKAFLDRYPSGGLVGVVAVPVMTGGSAHHAMAIDTALRPVLVELGASVPSRGLYFEIGQMDKLDSIVDAWAQHNVAMIQAVVDRRVE